MPFEFGDFTPMKCVRADAPFSSPDYRFEPKFDGIRALAYADARGRVRLQGRSGRDLTRTYPDVCDAVAAALDGVPAVIDGEICALDERGVPDFAMLLRRENVADATRAADLAARAPLQYYAFDLLAVEETPLVADALEARRQGLSEVAANLDHGFTVVDFLPGSGDRAFRECVRAGYEGVVAKRVASPYAPGVRSRDWTKVKHTESADFVVGAWFEGEGALAGTLGAMALGAFDDAGKLRYVGRVGTGLTFDERGAVRDALARLAAPASPFEDRLPKGARFVRPALVVEVEFMQRTKDGQLRAPAFRGVRPDKPPRECRLATEGVALG